MSKILISTIVRNEARYLDRYYGQLRAMAEKLPEHQFALSIFENDSDDGSAAKLASFDWSFLPAFHLTSAKLQTPHFIGGKHPVRTQLLADARNRSLFYCGFLPFSEWVLVVEPDTTFTPEIADRIINHERHYGRRLDVFTGKSVHPGSDRLYDSWGTRRLAAHTDWCDGDRKEDGGFEELWSTFNCLSIYRADAVLAVKGFGGVNERTNQPDCDTVVICERFRAAGFNQIYWDTTLHVAHDCA